MFIQGWTANTNMGNMPLFCPSQSQLITSYQILPKTVKNTLLQKPWLHENRTKAGRKIIRAIKGNNGSLKML